MASTRVGRGCGGHFRGQQKSARLHQQETDGVVQRMSECYKKWSLNFRGDAVFHQRGEAGDDAGHDRAGAQSVANVGILGDVVRADSARFFDEASGHAAKGGADHSQNPTLRSESKNYGDSEFASIGAGPAQGKDLVDSPEKRSQQAKAEDQSGRSSLFFQSLVDLAQLGDAGVPLLLPARKFFGMQDHRFHQDGRWKKLDLVMSSSLARINMSRESAMFEARNARTLQEASMRGRGQTENARPPMQPVPSGSEESQPASRSRFSSSESRRT